MRRLIASLLLITCGCVLGGDEPLILHLVPHSYDAPFFSMIDQFFPDSQQELT